MQLLEHVHLDLKSIPATETFLTAALPEMKKRGRGLFIRFRQVGAYRQWAELYCPNRAIRQ